MNTFRSYILFLFDLQELVVRLTDERDLFFLYTLRIGEEDFQRYVEIGILPFLRIFKSDRCIYISE